MNFLLSNRDIKFRVSELLFGLYLVNIFVINMPSTTTMKKKRSGPNKSQKQFKNEEKARQTKNAKKKRSKEKWKKRISKTTYPVID